MTKEICKNYTEARKERRNDIDLGVIGNGTLEYNIMGCFECSGLDVDCINYEEVKKDDTYL